MRVLIVDRAPPFDRRQGNSLIGREVFPRLSQEHELTLVCPVSSPNCSALQEGVVDAFEESHLVPIHRPITALTGYVELVAAGMLPRVLPPERRQDLLAFRARVDHLVRHGRFDLVHFRQLPTAGTAESIHGLPAVLELVDAEMLQARRGTIRSQPTTLARYLAARAIESRALSHFDVVTTVSPADAAALRELRGTADVRVVPNGVDAAYFAPSALECDAARVVFVGAMSFPPNVDAVARFHRDVWPIIRAQIPDARFDICGRDPSAAVRALAGDPSVTVTGTVEDVRDWMAPATVIVCPMYTGSGIKNKVLEALAMGKAVVSSSLGVEALEVTDGVDIAVADAPDYFAERIISLIRNPEYRSSLGASGRRRVIERYTWDACAETYDALYQELAEAHRSAAAGTRQFAVRLPDIDAGRAA